MDASLLYPWNPWWKTGRVPDALKHHGRPALEEIRPWIHSKRIKILQGPRRSGKTTLMYQAIDELLTSGVRPGQIMFVNLQDPALAHTSLDELFLAFVGEFNEKETYVFLDEVQQSDGWERWVTARYDRGDKMNFFITGSTSRLSRPEYAAHLTGRTVNFSIWPLSLGEILRIEELERPKTLEEETRARHIYEDYIKYGGFPEIFFSAEEERRKLLMDYTEDMLSRDVVGKHGADYAKASELFRWILTNPGKPTSVHRLGKLLGTSDETINNYIGYLKEAFLLLEVKKFSYTLKEQLVSPRKFYPIDPGLAWANGFNFSADAGRALETTAALSLAAKGKEFYHYKNGEDIDFVIRDGKNLTAIQVTLDPSLEREQRKPRGMKLITVSLTGKTTLWDWIREL